MKETDKAWLAAAIDGEGTIAWYVNRKSGVPYITVCNNHKGFVEKAQKICRYGGIYSRQAKLSTNYVYTITQLNAVGYILKEIMPYLIVKKKKAEMVLEKILKKVDKLGVNEKGKNNHLKGNKGNSEQHSKSAKCAKNNHLKGWRGNSDAHRRASLMRCKTAKH